jgi:hypothetical protein
MKIHSIVLKLLHVNDKKQTWMLIATLLQLLVVNVPKNYEVE